MTIDEAIKELDKLGWTTEFALNPAQAAAVQLGIEALKHIRLGRESVGLKFAHRLPGETEE